MGASEVITLFANSSGVGIAQASKLTLHQVCSTSPRYVVTLVPVHDTKEQEFGIPQFKALYFHTCSTSSFLRQQVSAWLPLCSYWPLGS